MKKLSLRVRFALMASLFLLISCTTLTSLSNASANRMVDAIELRPSVEIGRGSEATRIVEPAVVPPTTVFHASYETFRRDSVIATCIIILVGSAAAYFAAGYVLEPIHTLSGEVKKRNVDTLGEAIPVPQSADEIQELTLSFNQMMAELKRSFAMQRQFSADAAHELRTPLAVMQTKLDVYKLSAHTDAEVQVLIAALNEQVERLTLLIEDLLWFSQDLPLESVQPVDLRPLLEDVAEELSDLAAHKQIVLQITGEDGVVQGQDRLLERVFYNLMENAIKYSPQKTTVTVSLQKHADRLRVCVKDQGEGIPEAYRKTVFDPFVRVDASRSRAVGGSGLGLSVCKKILERHHASICALPNAPTGSIFQIDFAS